MKTYYKRVLSTLDQLHKDYPSYPLARHISSATADYGDIWGLSDKDLYEALRKYQSIMEIDPNMASDDFVDKIEEDAQHIFETDYFSEEEDENE